MGIFTGIKNIDRHIQLFMKSLWVQYHKIMSLTISVVYHAALIRIILRLSLIRKMSYVELVLRQSMQSERIAIVVIC